MSIFEFANPKRFMQVSGGIPALDRGAAVVTLLAGWRSALPCLPITSKATRCVIMFLHVPAAWTAMMAYGLMALASAIGLINRHPLADVAAKAAAPLGAVFTALGLVHRLLMGQADVGRMVGVDGAADVFPAAAAALSRIHRARQRHRGRNPFGRGPAPSWRSWGR